MTPRLPLLCIILLALNGCRTQALRISDSPNPLREGAYRAETRAWQDSTYRYVRDSVVVYVGRPPLTPPQEGNSDTLTAPPLEGLGEVLELGRSHYHTEWRDRVVVKTDTVFCDREVVVQLPPERYVPRFYKYGTIAGMLAAVWFIVRMVLKIRKRLF